MNCYLVFMKDGKERIEETFPTAHFWIDENLWAIGSEVPTCVDVCELLGIDTDNRMIVVPMNDYYGRFDRALWQRLEAWSRM